MNGRRDKTKGASRWLGFRPYLAGARDILLLLAAAAGPLLQGASSSADSSIGTVSTLTTPLLGTGTSAGITTTGATLNGTVNPIGLVTTAQFEYGTTLSYGASAAVTLSPNNGSAVQNVSASVSGLSSGVLYHYRLVATNSFGTAYGADQTFVTISTNASLSGVSLSAGTLAPSFDANTTTYSAVVSNATSAVTLTPTLSHATSTVTINGMPVASGSPSSAISLSVGTNVITAFVTAQDGAATKTYTFNVTRALSSNADLASLVPGAGILSPVFASSTTSYTTGVSDSTASLTVTPTLADNTSAVTVNGSVVASGDASGPVNLGYGGNIITIVVTAQDGITSKTYIVAVNRAAPIPLNAIFTTSSDVALTTNGFTATGSSVNLALSFVPPTGTNLMVVKNTGLGFIGGTFDNLAQGEVVLLTNAGITYSFVANYFGGTGNDLVLVWKDTRAFSWGKNGGGELGDGTTTDHLVPTAVANGAGTSALAGKTVLAVASGGTHSLALCSDGSVAAWGVNSQGQLGDGTTVNSILPIAVSTAPGFSALAGKTVVGIAAGSAHSLALCSDGTVVAWGASNVGQLGDGGLGSSSLPVAVNAVAGTSALAARSVVSIAADEDHNLALCSDGTLAAWGGNASGQLGDGTTISRRVPVAVNVSPGLSALAGKSVTGMAAGSHYSLALCSDGMLASWGLNDLGQLGDGTTVNRSLPVAVSAAPGLSALAGRSITHVAAGARHNLALCSNGTVISWGGNTFGPLGDATDTNRKFPVTVNSTPGLSALDGKTVVNVATGDFHSLALCSDGMLAAWGYNASGQLGDNSTIERTAPVAVDVTPLGAGGRFTGFQSDGAGAFTLALVAAPPPSPTVKSLAATSLTASSATLNGTVNANFNSAVVSFDYGLTNTYGASIPGTPTSVSGGNAATVAASLTGLLPGTTYHFRVSAENANGVSHGEDLIFTTPTLVEAWRQTWFGSPADAGESADDFDFDHDGVPNIFEYAFGLNPTLGTSMQLPQGHVSNGQFEISFPSPVGVDGITYGAEWSASLSALDWHSIPDTGSGSQHTFSVPAGGDTRMFVRLKVMRP